MKYYVLADVHGYYSMMMDKLNKAGYFKDKEPHKLILCGDLFDRYPEEKEMEEFLVNSIEKDEAILIRGNHEDLTLECLEALKTAKDWTDVSLHFHQNGTINTLIALSNFDGYFVDINPRDLYEKAKDCDYIKKIIPSMVNYYETDNFIFVHGWIPYVDYLSISPYKPSDAIGYYRDWRNAFEKDWHKARWANGMKMWKNGCREKDKTIVCGHWHTSWGHSKIHREGSEFKKDADFSPFYEEGVIAIDACTAHSNQMNLIIIED